MGKGENAGYQHFLLFPQCFQKFFVSRSLELGIVWYRIKPFPKQALVFRCLQCKSFKNTVGKGEIAHKEQFLLFPQCFLFLKLSFNFHQIQNCCLQTVSVWKSLKFVDWEKSYTLGYLICSGTCETSEVRPYNIYIKTWKPMLK